MLSNVFPKRNILYSLVKWASKDLDLLIRGLAHTSAISILAMTALVAADTLMRYVFNKPITGAFEFSESYLLVATVFLGLPMCQKVGAHIRATLFVERFPERSRTIVSMITLIVALGIIALLAWRSGLLVVTSLITRERLWGVTGWPIFPGRLIVFVGFFCFGLELLAETVTLSRSLQRNR